MSAKPASAQLKPGDVVELNSGGPAMIVERVDGGKVRVRWAASSTRIERHDFPIEALTRIA